MAEPTDPPIPDIAAMADHVALAAWLATRPAWEIVFIACVAAERAIPNDNAIAALSPKQLTGIAPAAEARRLSLQHAMTADVAPSAMEAVRVAISRSYLTVSSRLRPYGSAARETLSAAAGMLPQMGRKGDYGERKASRRIARDGADAVRYGAMQAAWDQAVRDSAPRMPLMSSPDELRRVRDQIVRLLALPEPRRTRLRIAWEVEGPDTTPDSLLSFAGRHDDAIRVALDLVAERDWTDDTVRELRTLLGR